MGVAAVAGLATHPVAPRRPESQAIGERSGPEVATAFAPALAASRMVGEDGGGGVP